MAIVKSEDKKLPYTSANSELLSIRVSKELLKALDVGARENNASLPEHVREILYGIAFYEIIEGYYDKLKVRFLKEPGNTQEKLARLSDDLESYCKAVDTFIGSNKEVEALLLENKRAVRQLQVDIKRQLEEMYSSVAKTLRKRNMEKIERLHT